jgi:hypothetical protein
VAGPSTFNVQSGFVLGDEDSGCQRHTSLSFGGEAQGLDCVFRNLSKVLCVYFHDKVVFYMYIDAVFVTCTTTWI